MKYIFNFHKYYYYLVPLISVNENTIRSLLYEMVYNQVGYYHTIQYSSLRFIDVNKEEHTVQFKPEKKYESNNIIVGLLPKKVAYSLFQKYLNTFDENEVNKLFIQFNTQVEISLSSNFSDRIKDWFQHFFNVILDEEDYIKIVFYHTPQNAEVLREFLLNIFLVHFNWFMIPNTSSVYSFISTQLFSRIVGNIKNFFLDGLITSAEYREKFMEEEKNKTFFLPALEEKSIGEVSTDMKEIPFSNMDFLHLLVKYGIHIRMMSADSQYIIIEDINAILNTLWYKNLPMPMIIAEEKEIIATIDPDHRKQIRTVLDILFEKKKQEYLDCETKLKGYDAFQQEIQKYITVEEEMYEYCKGKGIEFVQEIVQEYIISPEKIQEYIKFAQYREEDERKRMQQHKKEKAEKYDLENLRPNDIFHSYETLDFVEDTYIQEKIQDYIFAEQKTWEYTFIKQKIQDHIFPQEMLLQKMQECIVYFQKVQDCCQKKIQKYFTQKMKEHTNSYQKIQKYMATLPRKSSGISNSIDMEMYMQQYIFSKRKIQEYSIFKEKISEYITAEEKRRSYCQQKLEEYHKTKHLFQDILWENMLIIKKIYHLPLNRGPLKFTDVTKEEKIIMPIVREGVFSLFVLPVKPDIVL